MQICHPFSLDFKVLQKLNAFSFNWGVLADEGLFNMEMAWERSEISGIMQKTLWERTIKTSSSQVSS